MLAPICLIIGFATMVQAIYLYNDRGVLRNQGRPDKRVPIFPRDGKLDLSNLKIWGIEPGLLSRMNNVNIMILSENKLITTTNFFNSVPSSTVVIRADKNSISAISPINFQNCQQLDTINLGNNRLWSLRGVTFLNVPNLRKLVLFFNQIRDIDSTFFTNLQGLTELYLDGNRIETLPDGVFANLINIQRISMQDNGLHIIRTNIFGRVFPRTLKNFDVFRNPLTVFHSNVMIFGLTFRAQPNSRLIRVSVPNSADNLRRTEIVHGSEVNLIRRN